MTKSEREIAQALRSLQAMATLCANTFTTPQLKVEYRVAYSALVRRSLAPGGESTFPQPRDDNRYSPAPDALLRTSDLAQRRSGPGARQVESPRSAAPSPATWVKVRASSDGYLHGQPEPRPGVDLSELRPARLELRAQICVTRPERVVDLLNS